MRKLGEQWVEELDGKKHMLKAVHNEKKNCNGCVHGRDYNKDSCLAEPKYPCGYMDFIIKDLGDIDGIGALRCPFCRQYPSLDYAEEQFRLLCKDENHLIDVGFHATLQQAIDAWNRRA